MATRRGRGRRRPPPPRENIEACPCGSTLFEICEELCSTATEIRCPDCDRTTGMRENRLEAIRAWNARAESEAT